MAFLLSKRSFGHVVRAQPWRSERDLSNRFMVQRRWFETSNLPTFSELQPLDRRPILRVLLASSKADRFVFVVSSKSDILHLLLFAKRRSTFWRIFLAWTKTRNGLQFEIMSCFGEKRDMKLRFFFFLIQINLDWKKKSTDEVVFQIIFSCIALKLLQCFVFCFPPHCCRRRGRPNF